MINEEAARFEEEKETAATKRKNVELNNITGVDLQTEERIQKQPQESKHTCMSLR